MELRYQKEIFEEESEFFLWVKRRERHLGWGKAIERANAYYKGCNLPH